ncbi:hypothetical protein [Novosphingobium olei]|uniref:hypothetical protein n=1 Tax=Novosphingobium olei TaxID=2728851 RepID=UPI00308C7AC9|nr:hypothetical protein NSDW_01360 [Novosphingobium olei]
MADQDRRSTGNRRTTPRAQAKPRPAKRAKRGTRWQEPFLAALAESSNVTAAAAAAKVDTSKAYKARRQDADFARAWRAALLEGYEHLEMELLRRMRFGEGRDDDRKFDNANAMRLLSQHRETVARERAQRDNDDVATIRASLDAQIASLRDVAQNRRNAELAAARAEGAAQAQGDKA